VALHDADAIDHAVGGHAWAAKTAVICVAVHGEHRVGGTESDSRRAR
jgi:hypothetical protein